MPESNVERRANQAEPEPPRTRRDPAPAPPQAPSFDRSAFDPRDEIVVPSITAPKGGGAVRSISERFRTNPATGTGSLTVSLGLSPGRQGFGPTVSLGYDSGLGNGPFGLGWSAAVPRIERKTSRGVPEYTDDADTFLVSGLDDLVLVATIHPDHGSQFRIDRYRPRVESAFVRVERWTNTANGEVHWRTYRPDNVLSLFGTGPQGRIADPDDPRRVFAWLLEESRDDKGNVIQYRYKGEDFAGVDRTRPHEANRSGPGAQRYLKRIFYGNTTPGQAGDWLFEVVFDYGEHTGDGPGEDVPWPARQDPFSTHRAGFEMRTYRLCRRILMFHRFAELAPNPHLVRATELVYQESPSLTLLREVWQRGFRGGNSEVAPPAEFDYSPVRFDDRLHVVANNPAGFPVPASPGRAQWVDLDGEGLVGVLEGNGDAWYYRQPLGNARWAEPRLLDATPVATAPASERYQLLDLGADGRLDLVRFARAGAGYFERAAGDSWSEFRMLPQVPIVDWSDPNVRFLDVTGDGLADLVVSEDDVFVCYRSEGHRGFRPAVRVKKPRDDRNGAAVVFAEPAVSIHFADMTGDGLTDIVRVTARQVEYWPNLGHGRFGAHVAMESPPVLARLDRFDGRRVRLADVDGSGPADLIYLGEDGVSVWFNESGNSWGLRHQIRGLPLPDFLSDVSVVDLLGQGTACVVWASARPGATPALAYVDLLGGAKPHLLVAARNNLGGETRIAYAPSTQFALSDRAAGTPWLTRLHFPVHVVERIESEDLVAATRSVRRFVYHHGHFDPYEREFHGFGMVETWDTDTFTPAGGPGLYRTAPTGAPPPVHVKTWFHTGAWLDLASLEAGFRAEYYSGDPRALALPQTILPDGLRLAEQRDACRALRGRVLREEVYAEDQSPQASVPYVVRQHVYEVRPLARATPTRRAIFTVLGNQSVEARYDRDPTDPRVSHSLVLAIDDFAAVLRSATVAYPRRGAPPHVDQAAGQVTIIENDVTHQDAPPPYRLGTVTGTRRWELLNFDVTIPVTAERLNAAFDGAAALGFHEPATPPGHQRRLRQEATRRFYLDDLSGPGPARAVGSRALPYEAEVLAFTTQLLATVFANAPASPSAAALAEGGYRQDGSRWWAPSGRAIYDPALFYLPIAVQDPFGNTRRGTYDRYGLLPIRVRDALGFETVAAPDYAALAPWRVTDPNGTFTETTFDPLGRVTATAIVGAQGEGDTLADPTATFEYHQDEWRLRRRPAYVRSRAREQHAVAQTRWQESRAYSDGWGRDLMTKVRAEAGDAPMRDGGGALLLDGQGNLVWGHTNPRWIGTGRTIFDEKERPVKRYEPYFSATAEYEPEAELVQQGVTSVLHYDPIDRVVRVENPDGTEVRAEYTPWRTRLFDENDTVTGSAWETERLQLPNTDPSYRAATLSARHAGTPMESHHDALGRVFLIVEDNGGAGRYETRLEFDVDDNAVETVDARGNVATAQWFDHRGQVLHSQSADAGRRWIMTTADNLPLRAWDDLDRSRRARYDALRRPTHLYVTSGGIERLQGLTVFGEALANPRAVYHVGRIYQIYDGAGMATTHAYDFKGNPRTVERRFTRDPRAAADWSALDGLAALPAIENVADVLLQPASYTSRTQYDALDRVVAATTPDQTTRWPTYNEGGLLEGVSATVRGSNQPTPFVTAVAYDARGRRTLIQYGNGLQTDYAYDGRSRRLVRLHSSDPGPGLTLQDLRYVYDAKGNVVELQDHAQQTVYFRNAVVHPHRRYEYDAIDRLVRAQGREHPGQQPTEQDLAPFGLPHPNNGAALVRYDEEYRYDAAGNITDMEHVRGGATAWHRRYAYEVVRNRLQSTSLPGDPAGGPYSASYDHDAHGNMARMPHLPVVTWNDADQLARVDFVDGRTAYYTYDANGERVRKVIEHPGGPSEERLYLGDYEVYRRTTGAGVRLERETLHVQDDRRRIALVETTTIDQGDSLPQPVMRVRYQLDDHLGSSCVELDEQAQVIGYEEYFPYGGTAYRAVPGAVDVSPKRYRYAGKERDEETGFDYFGARYYAPWLGRWTAADPAGDVDGTNRYAFTTGNPIGRKDEDGRQTGGVSFYETPPVLPLTEGTHVFPFPSEYDPDLWLWVHVGPQGTERRASTFAFLTTDYEEILRRVQGDEDVANRLLESAEEFNDYIIRSIIQGQDPVDARRAWLSVNLGEAFVEGLFSSSGLGDVPTWVYLVAIVLTAGRVRIGGGGPRSSRGVAGGSGGGPGDGGLGGGGGGGGNPRGGSGPSVRINVISQEIVKIDPATGVPLQRSGPKVGPAYRTFEEARASGVGTHYVEVIVKERGRTVARWWEVSEGGRGGRNPAGDTEQKALSRINLRPGVEIHFQGGAYPPCGLPGGCMNTMRALANQTGVEISYRTTGGAVYYFRRGYEPYVRDE